MAKTTCAVVGGGPAGMILGLLLARGGVPVTVLEKHADFLRDFRGDTVHASTLTLLDELGLSAEFARLPHRLLEQLTFEPDVGSITISLDRLPGNHQHIAMVPQWDLLELLATAAEREPRFTLIRNAEVTSLLTEGDRVVGVRYRDRTQGPAAGEHELRADLTVGCDGRHSVVRAAAGMHTRSFGVPIDVWWFRLPRHDSDQTGVIGRISTGHMAAMFDRGDYWQCAYVIHKGSDVQLRAAGVEALRAEFGGLVPWTRDRLDALRSWDDVKLLDVKLDRVKRWSADGVLVIGDAAHAMSPVGGVGINLAVADAVATARLLAGPLRTGGAGPAQLTKVQRRRWWPTVVIQGGQRLVHRFVLAPRVNSDGRAQPRRRMQPSRLPLPMQLLGRFLLLRALPTRLLARLVARLIALSPLPEHAPQWARRTASTGSPMKLT
ncbi:MAG: FAD-dependent oxidoreductase [Pseudonocardia sp.]|nr:FAD-dependent oxidoreductase [Pseudonocardia sp.]